MNRIADWHGEAVAMSCDRSEWNRGPWDDEPDDDAWSDPATGLPCVARRNRWGCWCGYVAVPLDSPAAISEMDENIDVHGGVSFGSRGDQWDRNAELPIAMLTWQCLKLHPEQIYWIGFDCHHAWDLAPVDRPLLNDHPEDIYRTLDFVKSQCALLAHQLKQLLSTQPVPAEDTAPADDSNNT